MNIGVIYENGKEIRRGLCFAVKYWTEKYPEQFITIAQDTKSEEKETFFHNGIITFQELKKTDRGWKVIYDSEERIDHSESQELPKWFLNGPIPIHENRINEDGEIESKFIGYLE